jgi:hypothetical protein
MPPERHRANQPQQRPQGGTYAYLINVDAATVSSTALSVVRCIKPAVRLKLRRRGRLPGRPAISPTARVGAAGDRLVGGALGARPTQACRACSTPVGRLVGRLVGRVGRGCEAGASIARPLPTVAQTVAHGH